MNQTYLAVFASTGGKRIINAVRSFRKMEPHIPVYVMFDISSKSWNNGGGDAVRDWLYSAPHGLIGYGMTENDKHINGVLNAGMRQAEKLGYSHVVLFHDDLVFSPLPEHRGSLAFWLQPAFIEGTSGMTFGHLECFVRDPGDPFARRPPAFWDAIDLDSPELWRQMFRFPYNNGYEVELPGQEFYVRYEGPDKVRKWNRLGPTGQVVPVATWKALGGFDEVAFVHYDQDYTSEVFRRGWPPVYAVPNVPWLHLHNQSMRPDADVAPEPWGRGEAYVAKFGADWPGYWRSDWAERWQGGLPLIGGIYTDR